MNLEAMLMDILENKTAIGLSEEDLLRDICKTVFFTTVYADKPSAAAVPHKNIANVTSLAETVNAIIEVAAFVLQQ